MNDGLNIAFLSTSMGLGGADQQILSVCKRLQERGHEVKIISLVPIGQMGEEAQKEGIPVSSLGIQRKIKTPLHLFQLRRLIGDVDILHTHMYHANILGRLLRSFISAKSVVNTIHNVYESGHSYENPNKKSMRNHLYSFTKDRCDLTTCVSNEAYERFVNIGAIDPTTASVVYNGVDIEKYCRSPKVRTQVRDEHDVSNEFIWLSVGRFFEQKDHSNLLNAFSRMKNENTRLWLIGHGKLEQKLKEMSLKLDIEDKVDFLGTVDDVSKYMAAADGFVLSSKWEGFGIVLAEAQASELPVVATRVGGIPEVIQDGQSGFLVPPRDSEALAEELDRVSSMQVEQREKIGRSGRQNVKRNFSLDTITDDWDQIYSSLAAN